ncbi:hypothetical protein AAT19DRAFT_12985 [Rhodotorula toruloides]|uniref:Uncharacterized protein n=1 Tax=Rhodotorula toruloides TaxID=5286 RepID=A0A2T0AD94_RHOTO|nr:hypothetical protein AAT19DRAFT_12985 [Rhodotorula toruloides]
MLLSDPPRQLILLPPLDSSPTPSPRGEAQNSPSPPLPLTSRIFWEAPVLAKSWSAKRVNTRAEALPCSRGLLEGRRSKRECGANLASGKAGRIAVNRTVGVFLACFSTCSALPWPSRSRATSLPLLRGAKSPAQHRNFRSFPHRLAVWSDGTGRASSMGQRSVSV